METFTIQIDNKQASLKLKRFLKDLDVKKVEISKIIPENPATVHSIEEIDNKIINALNSRKLGKFKTEEEFEKITSGWLNKNVKNNML